MPEDLARFSEVPRREPKKTPPFVDREEINPESDLRPVSPESMVADDIALLMDAGPKEGESPEAYEARQAAYRHSLREGLEDDDRAPIYEVPPTSVH